MGRLSGTGVSGGLTLTLSQRQLVSSSGLTHSHFTNVVLAEHRRTLLHTLALSPLTILPAPFCISGNALERKSSRCCYYHNSQSQHPKGATLLILKHPHEQRRQGKRQAVFQKDKAFLMPSSFPVSQPQSSQVLQLLQLEHNSSHS